MSSSTRQTPGWEELPDNYVPIDVVRGTSLLCYTNEEIAAAGGESEEEEGSALSETDRKEVEDTEDRQQRLVEEEKAELHMRDEQVRTEEDRIQSFIEEYVALHHITRGYRFVGAREGALQAG
jgi:hypothetical protein